MIDTHCHLLNDALADRVPSVISQARAAGVGALITVGTTTADSLASAELAGRHPEVWSTAGVHPLHALDPRDWDEMRRAGAHPR
ncbi:MAG: TatD family hydrolase, partial [Phycisphaerales bacterium]